MQRIELPPIESMARSLAPDVRSAIERAAREEGVDPTLALAIAERESNFNPRAKSSKTIRGMFQMTHGLRQQYGIGDSDDPYEQARGWARFIKDTRGQMSAKAGRDVTDTELYAGHHFGAGRAGRMLKMDPTTTVDQVFTPYERSLNPHFDRAGTVGNLLGSVTSDIGKRQAKFGGAAPDLGLIDFAKMGEPVDGPENDLSGNTGVLADFSGKAEPSSEVANLNTSAPAASSAPDFSQFGDPA